MPILSDIIPRRSPREDKDVGGATRAYAGGEVDNYHVTRYKELVIKTFGDKHTEELFVTGKSHRLPPDLMRRAVRRMEYISLARGVDDLRIPTSNRLHKLKGDRKGQYSISINDQWRVCFRFSDGDAFDVEVVDYH